MYPSTWLSHRKSAPGSNASAPVNVNLGYCWQVETDQGCVKSKYIADAVLSCIEGIPTTPTPKRCTRSCDTITRKSSVIVSKWSFLVTVKRQRVPEGGRGHQVPAVGDCFFWLGRRTVIRMSWRSGSMCKQRPTPSRSVSASRPPNSFPVSLFASAAHTKAHTEARCPVSSPQISQILDATVFGTNVRGITARLDEAFQVLEVVMPRCLQPVKHLHALIFGNQDPPSNLANGRSQYVARRGTGLFHSVMLRGSRHHELHVAPTN